MTETNYRGWVYPTPGEDTDWGATLNNLFEEIAADTTRFGPAADRPSEPPVAGAGYVETDGDNRLWIGNSAGDGWNEVGSLQQFDPQTIDSASDLGFDPATQTELDTQTHPLGDLDTSGASSGQVAKYDGSNWVPGTDERGTNTLGLEYTTSGDGTTTSFTIPHSLGRVPSVVSVEPASEDASTDFWVVEKTSTDLTISYARAPPSGTDNLAFEVIVTGETYEFASRVTKSGDGNTVSFTIPHSLGTVPSVVSITPASEDASTDFWVSEKTSTDLTISYASAPPSGIDNLAFEVSLTGRASDFASRVTKSGDGSTASFTFPHSLGSTPSVVSITSASKDASTDFWVSEKTSTDLTISYPRAPPSGTDNLVFEVAVPQTSHSGSTGIDIENSDGTTLLPGANPIQAGDNLSWTDDGDESATLDATDTDTHATAQDEGAEVNPDPSAYNFVGSGVTASTNTNDGSIVDVDAGTSDGASVASPGNIQTTIDDVNAAGGGVVKLVSGEVYDPASTIEGGQNVILDFNGAKMEPSTDQDTFLMERGFQIYNPRIDYSVNLSTFSSVVFDRDPKAVGSTAGLTSQTLRSVVKGGYVEGTGSGDGSTIFRLHGKAETDSNGNVQQYPLSYSYSSTHGEYFGTAIEIHSEEEKDSNGDPVGNTWVNSNYFDGVYRYCQEFVHDYGTGDVFENRYAGAYQTGNGTDYGWLQEAPNGRRNTWWGQLWDSSNTNVAAIDWSGDLNAYWGATSLGPVTGQTDSNYLPSPTTPHRSYGPSRDIYAHMRYISSDDRFDIDTWTADGGRTRHVRMFQDRAMWDQDFISTSNIGAREADLTTASSSYFPSLRVHDGTSGRAEGWHATQSAGGSGWDGRVRIGEQDDARRSVGAGSWDLLSLRDINPGETFAIWKAGLTVGNGQPAPSGLDMVVVTADGAGGLTRQDAALVGDGTSQNELDGTGTASLASYTYPSSSSGEQATGLAIDNGGSSSNSGTGSAQEYLAHFDFTVED